MQELIPNNTSKGPLASNQRKGGAGRIKTRILTIGQFETIRPFLRISNARIDAARLAMVEGLKFEDIAKEKGWRSRQAVDRAVSSVWKTWEKYKESQVLAAQYNEQKDN